MKKVIGYILALVGFAIIVSGLGFFQLSFFEGAPAHYSIIAGIIVIIFSIMFLKDDMKEDNKVQSEIPKDLPIYEGDQIIGYRRPNDNIKDKGKKRNKKKVTRSKK